MLSGETLATRRASSGAAAASRGAAQAAFMRIRLGAGGIDAKTSDKNAAFRPPRDNARVVASNLKRNCVGCSGNEHVEERAIL